MHNPVMRPNNTSQMMFMPTNSMISTSEHKESLLLLSSAVFTDVCAW